MPGPERDTVVRALMAAATPVLQREYSVDCCILATRIAVEALDAFGVRARPQAVGLMVFNAEAQQLISEGMELPELHAVMMRHTVEEPGGPWLIGVNPAEEARNGRFNGHLVAEVDELLIDLTLPQVSRPHKGIKLEPAVFETDEQWRAEGWVSYPLADGSLAVYERADSTSWQMAPDWQWPVRGSDGIPRRALHRQNTGEIIRAMRKELGK